MNGALALAVGLLALVLVATAFLLAAVTDLPELYELHDDEDSAAERELPRHIACRGRSAAS
jgi:hypothetical protein